jgi:hypothetical protein
MSSTHRIALSRQLKGQPACDKIVLRIRGAGKQHVPARPKAVSRALIAIAPTATAPPRTPSLLPQKFQDQFHTNYSSTSEGANGLQDQIRSQPPFGRDLWQSCSRRASILTAMVAMGHTRRVIGAPMITVLPTASRTDEVRERFPNRLHIGVAKEQQERSPVFSNILPHHTVPCCRFLSSISSTLKVYNRSAAEKQRAVCRRQYLRPDWPVYQGWF